MISVVFISCGKKREAGKRTILQPLPPKQRPLNTQPMNRAKNFVTNINGELIPVTTGKDGSVEFYEDLITKTSEQAAETEPNGKDESQKPNDAPTKGESGTVKNRNR